ncbi:MaoC/PaaZ C-terminal domain-containing protein [Amorphus sp. MBR-141]
MEVLPITTEGTGPLGFLEDIAAGERRRLGSTEMLPSAVKEFAQALDPFPFHLDEEFGRSSIFGGMIVSGLHTLAATHALAIRSGFLDARTVVGGAGLDDVRFSRPVYPGDMLTVDVEILEVRPPRRKPFGIVRIAYEVCNGAGEAVLTFTDNQVVKSRQGAPA